MEHNNEMPIIPPTPTAPTAAEPTPTTSLSSTANDKQNNTNGLKITAIVTCIIAIFGICFGVYGILQNTQKDKKILELQTQIDTLNEQIKSLELASNNSLISNTTWMASDGSEAIFSDTRIDWYQNPEDHSDNYYSGDYKFFIGEKAIDYITQELPEYGVTRAELDSLINRNDIYSKDNFVVFDLRYDKYVIDGKERTIARPLNPWYGFILKDNTYLDVANMNTGTYYKFTKSE